MRRLGSITALIALALAIAAFGFASPAGAAGILKLSSTTTSVVGGKSVTVIVKLDAKAPAEGAVVSLESSDTGVATVPSTLTIKSGSTSGTFSVKTKAVAQNEDVTVSGSYGNVTKSLDITVNAPSLKSISIPKSVVGGKATSGRVMLNGPAPASGITVEIETDGGTATAPSTVKVAVGKTSASFDISSEPVSDDVNTVFTVSLDSTTKSATLTVIKPSLSSFSFPTKNISDTLTVKGTIKLTGPAPDGGVEVALTTDDGAPLDLPDSVDVPAGKSSATFIATGTEVLTKTAVTVTATFGSSKSATITVNAPVISSLRFSPITIEYNGTTTGTVTLNVPAPTGGAVVKLTASERWLTIPSSVTIPAGSKSATFSATFSATASAPVSATFAKVEATYGLSLKASSVQIKARSSATPEIIEAIALPNPARGSDVFGVGVGLSAPAATGGFKVTIKSSNTAVIPISGTYTITAGNDTLVLAVMLPTVNTETTVTVTISGGGKSFPISVTVKPSAVTSSLSPTAARAMSGSSFTIAVVPGEAIATRGFRDLAA